MIRPWMSCAVAVALLAGLGTAAEAGWKCEKRHCFWDANFSGPVPDFAANWGPPEAPTCYYVQRRISKRWAKVCPEVPWQAR